MKIEKWSKDKLILLYKDLAIRLGTQPTLKQWEEDVNTPSNMPIRCHFGKWQNMVRICGDIPHRPFISELAKKNRDLAHKGIRSYNWKGGRIKDRLGYIQL